MRSSKENQWSFDSNTRNLLFKQTVPDKSDTEPPTKSKTTLVEKQKVIMMFYIMTRTDPLAFSSNQTWETWTSLNPLKNKWFQNLKKSDNDDQHNLNCTHFKTFVAWQPIITRKSLWHQVKVTIRYHQRANISWAANSTSAVNQAINHTQSKLCRDGRPLTLGPGKPRMPFSPLTPGRESKPWNHNHNPRQSFFVTWSQMKSVKTKSWFHRSFICCLNLPANPVVHRHL